MVRFLHTADWQIGKPYGEVGEEAKRWRLQQERIEAIGRIAAVVQRRQAAFVLVAGDLFDSPGVPPPPPEVVEVLEAIGALQVPVLAIPGNHDPGSPDSVWHREDFQREQLRHAPNLQLKLRREPLPLEQAVVLPCPPFCGAPTAPIPPPGSRPWLPMPFPRIARAWCSPMAACTASSGATSTATRRLPPVPSTGSICRPWLNRPSSRSRAGSPAGWRRPRSCASPSR